MTNLKEKKIKGFLLHIADELAGHFHQFYRVGEHCDEADLVTEGVWARKTYSKGGEPVTREKLFPWAVVRYVEFQVIPEKKVAADGKKGA